MFTTTVVCLLFAVVVRAAVVFHDKEGGLDKYKYIVSEDTINKYNAQDENSINYWREQGKATLLKRVATPQITTTAKNVIMFLGDGMSIPTLAAARIYLGQLNGTAGENSKLSFEKFPYTGFSKTYCVNKQVADSACTATAYLGGVKANFGTLGVNADVKRGNCTLVNDPDNRVHSILKWAQDAGKGTGIVTTTRITHASPGGNFAFTSERNFESDYDISKSSEPSASMCTDIAKQLIMGEPGKNVKVILGGGRVKFLPNTTTDYEYADQKGERLDGTNLVEEWRNLKTKNGASSKFVWNREQLLTTDISKTDYLMGLFEPEHMKYHLEANEATEPTLEELTRVAIKMLQKESKGFYLFVEGGRIDHGHHENFARRALDETVEMHKAVQAAVDMTDIQDTLIVVTSDHAHTMSFSGYPTRGDDILAADLMSDMDNKPYTTLSYANGPSAEMNQSRVNPKDYDLKNDTFRYPSLVPLSYETHGGDDVGIFASGPWSHLFSSTMEQNVIALSMGYAAGIGPTVEEESDTYRYPSLVKLGQETHGGEDVGVFARGPYAHLFVGVYEQNVIPLTMGYAADLGPTGRTEPPMSADVRIAKSNSVIHLSSLSIMLVFVALLKLMV